MIAIDILEDWLEYLMTDEDIHNNLDLIEDGEEQVKKSCEEIKHAIKVLKAHNPEVERLQERVKDLEYEVEHWQGELRSRMHPIDYDALVNGGEEE